jgi:hypothetical protein|tara:strand:+ start:230 stop:571 length:342 start_codon:yes stop_codon:yes gene_type:complete
LSFFTSDIVRAEMAEISELQEEVYSNVMNYGYMNKEDQIYHVEILEKLIDKQKILYARLSLSDDPGAKKMKEDIRESATMMGLPKEMDMNLIFGQMSQMVDVMKKTLDMNEVD